VLLKGGESVGLVSVVIRFRNESEHLPAVLDAVRRQRTEHSVEIIAVDNGSTDSSSAIAEARCDEVLELSDYRPGVALNLALEACHGAVVVPLSAHAIPCDESWLTKLLTDVGKPNVLAAYGGQVYPHDSRFLDKRDLDIFSGWARRREYSDSDFWNANSAFCRSEWESSPFDETVIEMEDHLWTKVNLGRNNFVQFEPSAHVYHYGHNFRNDRSVVDRSRGTSFDAEFEKLGSSSSTWAELMSAVMFVSSVPQRERTESPTKIIDALSTVFYEAADFDLRWRVAGALGRVGGPDAVRPLILGLADPSFYVRDECAWMLRKIPESRGPLMRVAKAARPDSLSGPYAGLALGLMDDVRAKKDGHVLLCDLIEAGDPQTLVDAIYYLGELDASVLGSTPPRVVHRVVEKMSGAWDDARAAIWCWGRLNAAGNPSASGSSYSRAVLDLARLHPQPVIRAEAITALRFLSGSDLGVRTAQEALKNDDSGRPQYAALETLASALAHGLEVGASLLASVNPDDFGVEYELARLNARFGEDGSV
jgi:hypothetical protein